MSYTKRTMRSFSPALNYSTPNDRKRTVSVPRGTLTGAKNLDIFRAGSEVVIDQISLLVSVALPVDAVNNWNVDVKVVSAGTGSVGQSLFSSLKYLSDVTADTVSANTDYDLNPSQNTILGPNDVLQFQATKFNAATNLTDLVVVIDYEVTGITTTTSTSTTTTTSTTTSTSVTTSSSTTTTVSTSTTLT